MYLSIRLVVRLFVSDVLVILMRYLGDGLIDTVHVDRSDKFDYLNKQNQCVSLLLFTLRFYNEYTLFVGQIFCHIRCAVVIYIDVISPCYQRVKPGLIRGARECIDKQEKRALS